MDASDQHLLSDFLGGREQAFRELSQRHMNLVYGVAMRNTADRSVAEEVVQDVFVLLARKARRLASHPCIAGWLHTTSRNVARDARRKRLGHQKKLARFAAESETKSSTAPDGHLEEIDAAVHSLPAPEKEAILLRFFEDRDYREIAKRLAISEPAARKRVSRGIQRLHSGLATKLAAGTALAIVAPAHLSQAVAGSITATTAGTSIPAAATANIVMTKSSTIIAGCAALAVSLTTFFAIDQSNRRKQLEEELAAATRELQGLRSGSASRTRFSATDRAADPELVANKKRIRDLEEQLLAETSRRELAEKDAAALREATAGLEDEVVLAFGKVEEIGTDFGVIFKEALALSELDAAGELEDDANKKRLINFSMKAAKITGLSKQIIEFDNEPEEGSRFFSATYRSIFDLDAETTSNLAAVFENQIAAAREKGLTLVNNPALKMLAGDETVTEAQIGAWLAKRQEFYRGVRAELREQFPAEKHKEFDKHIEEDGIGFNNIELKGNQLAFSLGGKQD